MWISLFLASWNLIQLTLKHCIYTAALCSVTACDQASSHRRTWQVLSTQFDRRPSSVCNTEPSLHAVPNPTMLKLHHYFRLLWICRPKNLLYNNNRKSTTSPYITHNKRQQTHNKSLYRPNGVEYIDRNLYSLTTFRTVPVKYTHYLGTSAGFWLGGQCSITAWGEEKILKIWLRNGASWSISE